MLAAMALWRAAGPTHSLGVAVCITGQVSRLEVASKVRNILEPLAAATNVDVFLSLASGGSVFNNPQTDPSDDGKYVCQSSLRSDESVRAAFAPYFQDSKIEPHHAQDEVETVVLDRWPYMYKWKHTGDDAHSNASRARHVHNVMSQMRHQKECAELIESYEGRAGGTYDVVLKVRDNSIAVRPVVPEKLLSVTTVTLKHCTYWWGFQDKVMVLPRRLLSKSLGSMYPTMLAVMNSDKLDERLELVSGSIDTEQVVKNVLTINGVFPDQKEFEYPDAIAHVPTPDGGDYLPFVDGRCEPAGKSGGEDSWCVVSTCKDCWPKTPWAWNVSCVIHGAIGEAAGISSFPGDIVSQYDCPFQMLR
jgi:hypothetical protein